MRFLLLFSIFVSVVLPVRAEGVAVLELFTSQYCADAYPADQLLHQLVDDNPNLIAISCHLEAMNRDGFSDPLSRSFCDERHGQYMRSLSLSSIKVPQAVLNGSFDMNPSREKLVRSGVSMARTSGDIRGVDMSVEKDSLEFTLPAFTLGGEEADVWLYAYNDYADAVVTDANNMPLKVPYVNYATHLIDLMDWDGSAISLSFPLLDIRSDGYVILVQTDSDGILAAGRVRHFPMSKPLHTHSESVE